MTNEWPPSAPSVLVHVSIYYVTVSVHTFSFICSEESLRHSKSSALKDLLILDNVDVDDAVLDIMKIKSISPEVHPQ